MPPNYKIQQESSSGQRRRSSPVQIPQNNNNRTWKESYEHTANSSFEREEDQIHYLDPKRVSFSQRYLTKMNNHHPCTDEDLMFVMDL